MKKLLIAVAALLIAATYPQAAHAHTLIMDDNKTVGAMLHINPDDNPIAGQPSLLFLDTQNTPTNKNTIATLTILGDNTQNSVQAIVSDSTAIFEYTFPSQGVYTLEFSIPSAQQTYTFTLDWRVSRGTISSALDAPRHPWAEIALLASGIGIALLATIMLGRWQQIRKQSTF